MIALMLNQKVSLPMLIEEIKSCICNGNKKDFADTSRHHTDKCTPSLHTYLISEGFSQEVINVVYRYPGVWVNQAMLKSLYRAEEYVLEMMMVISSLKSATEDKSITAISCMNHLGAKQKRWKIMHANLKQFEAINCNRFEQTI